MSNIVAVLIVRCTHTGVYADGRPNPASVTLYDLDEITIQKNRTRSVPIPAGSGTTLPPVDIPMSTRTFVSYHDGDICKFVGLGLITAEVILQLRDKENDGGPAGTGQALRPAVPNIERVGDELRLVIPNNVLPTDLSSVGFIVGEPVEITGLTGLYRKLNGEYVIDTAAPGSGLAGVDASSYLIAVPSEGADIASATLAGVNIRLSAPCGGGRVVAQFNSGGDVGGLGTNVYGYIGGQLFPNAGGGGGGAVAIYDEGVLIDAAATTIDFIGAGVVASSAGAGLVDITIPGGGGGGAPVNAEYLVLATDATLTDERVFTAGTGISIVDGGAGGAFTVSVDATWAEILANGNLSGGTDPTISTGDSIVGVTDLVLDPGAGVADNVIIDGLTWPSADGTAGQAIITNSFGVLSFGNPIPADHAPTHVHNGTDEIDGDILDITYIPTNYTRDTTPPEVTAVEELTAHLAGIDNALASVVADGSAILYWGSNSVANSTASRTLDPGYEARTAPLSTSTAIVDVRVPRAGTLRNLYVEHNNPGGTGATITYTVFVNGAATAIAAGLASTAAQAADTTNSVVVAAGDRVRIVVTKGAVAGAGARRPEVSLEVAA